MLRRVFGRAERSSDDEEAGTNLRLGRLLELIEESVGQRPPLTSARKGYAVLFGADEPIAFIRSQRARLRVTTNKQAAEAAGLSGWHRERSDTDSRDGGVSWYAPDGDHVAYQDAAAVLAELLKRRASVS